VATLGVLVGAGALGYMELIKAGILKYNRFDRRARGELRAGSPAPDFTLALYDRGTVRLSSLWAKKPVVLIFGSCT
jgi:hypothetical protein